MNNRGLNTSIIRGILHEAVQVAFQIGILILRYCLSSLSHCWWLTTTLLIFIYALLIFTLHIGISIRATCHTYTFTHTITLECAQWYHTAIDTTRAPYFEISHVISVFSPLHYYICRYASRRPFGISVGRSQPAEAAFNTHYCYATYATEIRHASRRYRRHATATV